MASLKKIKTKSIGHYILGKTIGEGTFGKVKLGTHILTGEKVAVKILEKERIVDVADVERVAREIHILKLIQHPHVIQLYEIIETPRQLYLIMEYCSGGELFDHIVACGRVEESEACRFFHQIIAGVELIHSMSVVHRDLKPENLLLDEQKNIKIVDFGLSNTFHDGQLLKTACGSPCYAAPEMIAGLRYVPSRCDLWSCGVILFALVCGYLPFEDPNTAALYQKILTADYQVPQFASQGAKELIAGLLNINSERRFTVEQVRAHPWYNQIAEASFPLAHDRNERDLEEDILDQLDRFGFPRDYAVKCVQMNKHNHVTTTYYLLAEKKRRMADHIFGQHGVLDLNPPLASGYPMDDRDLELHEHEAITDSGDSVADRMDVDVEPPPSADADSAGGGAAAVQFAVSQDAAIRQDAVPRPDLAVQPDVVARTEPGPRPDTVIRPDAVQSDAALRADAVLRPDPPPVIRTDHSSEHVSKTTLGPVATQVSTSPLPHRTDAGAAAPFPWASAVLQGSARFSGRDGASSGEAPQDSSVVSVPRPTDSLWSEPLVSPTPAVSPTTGSTGSMNHRLWPVQARRTGTSLSSTAKTHPTNPGGSGVVSGLTHLGALPARQSFNSSTPRCMISSGNSVSGSTQPTPRRRSPIQPVVGTLHSPVLRPVSVTQRSPVRRSPETVSVGRRRTSTPITRPTWVTSGPGETLSARGTRPVGSGLVMPLTARSSGSATARSITPAREVRRRYPGSSTVAWARPTISGHTQMCGGPAPSMEVQRVPSTDPALSGRSLREARDGRDDSRLCRGDYNVSCTSSKPLKQILAEVQRAMSSQRVAHKQVTASSLKCQMQALRFEVTIAPLEHLECVSHIRFRRTFGEVAAYNDVCAKILAELKV